ncbi:MAG TPA: ABC transporter ATP-binding protein [Treponemataceae bacterium]|nr:ABC transporter ATP-binding protein [Treponemataceae bacterium]
MISVEKVCKVYETGAQRVTALRDVSLEIAAGEFVALAGPSGSGKTTLLNLIGCLDSITSGEITLSGTPLARLDARGRNAMRRDRVGFIFQSYNLIPVLSARENVALALEVVGGLGARDIKNRVDRMLAEVGLSGLEDRRPTELSGGQQQRVSIARALVKEPPLVLADEPTANLDSRTGEETIALMESLNRLHGTTFVFSTHDQMVMNHARRVIRLRDGEIASDDRGNAT